MKHRGVEGGTVFGPPLCRSCRYATYIHGQSKGQELLFCAWATHSGRGKSMPFEAYECNQYENKAQPSLHEMRQTAWILRTDEFKNTIGFASPQRMRKLYHSGEENEE